jgi:hypothetical protein
MEGDDPDPLTARQRECLEARQQHWSAKEIGRMLGISHNTVHMHMRLARKRLSARGRERGDPGNQRLAQPPEDAAVDRDLILLLRKIGRLAYRFFFWVGVLVTIGYAGVTARDGLLIMAGKRSPAEPDGKCAIVDPDRQETDLRRADRTRAAAPLKASVDHR